jgi:hypothetical protein
MTTCTKTGAVAQIDEGHAAVVATAIHPSGERHRAADKRLGHLDGMMCSVSRAAHAASIP